MTPPRGDTDAVDKRSEQAICRAVRERLIVGGVYEDHHRILETYCHGFSSDSREMVVAFQIGGTSRSGPGIGWRAFYLSELKNLTILNERYVARSDYVPKRSKNLAALHCYVDAPDPTRR